MADRAYTIIRVWPWPGEENLSKNARDALAHRDLDGVDTDEQHRYGVVLDGDEQSGRILLIVDEEADGGVVYFGALIKALHDEGLNIYATNDTGPSFSARWQFCPAGGTSRWMDLHSNDSETIITAQELLDACTDGDERPQELDALPDAVVGAAAKRLLKEPPLPAAVLDVTP